MINKLEKQFFAKFGIEPIRYKRNVDDNAMFMDKVYPSITDSILLELICILSEWRTYLHNSYTIKANNTLNLKQDILKDFLELFNWYEFKKCSKDIKQQVCTLFEKE